MAQTVVCLQCRRPGFDPWVGKIPWRRKWQPTPVFLPGKSHGQRSLVGYRPWGRKESDTTERLHFHFQDLFLAKVKDFSVVFKIVRVEIQTYIHKYTYISITFHSTIPIKIFKNNNKFYKSVSLFLITLSLPLSKHLGKLPLYRNSPEHGFLNCLILQQHNLLHTSAYSLGWLHDEVILSERTALSH